MESIILTESWYCLNQGIFHRRESGAGGNMSTKQWDCLYKILMTYWWQKAFLHKKIHPFRVQYLSFSHNLTVRGKRKPRILAHFHTYSGELPSEGVWMVTHPWVANGNSGTDHFESFMKQSTWRFWTLCLRIEAKAAIQMITSTQKEQSGLK